MLVFSQFVKYLTIIRAELNKLKITYQYLDGATPENLRKKEVEAFQGKNSNVFLISLKAGGLGLNLTAADYVIHLDPWWNPAVEDQATDRAHRNGQKRPMNMYRLVMAGTVEERILTMHEQKRGVADTFLEGTDQVMSKASTEEELLDLLRPSDTGATKKTP